MLRHGSKQSKANVFTRIIAQIIYSLGHQIPSIEQLCMCDRLRRAVLVTPCINVHELESDQESVFPSLMMRSRGALKEIDYLLKDATPIKYAGRHVYNDLGKLYRRMHNEIVREILTHPMATDL